MDAEGAAFYSEMQDLAEELCGSFGRTITVNRYSTWTKCVTLTALAPSGYADNQTILGLDDVDYEVQRTEGFTPTLDYVTIDLTVATNAGDVAAAIAAAVNAQGGLVAVAVGSVVVVEEADAVPTGTAGVSPVLISPALGNVARLATESYSVEAPVLSVEEDNTKAFDNRLEDGSLVGRELRYVLLPAKSATFAPRALDELEFDGGYWEVVGCTPTDPAGVPVTYGVGVAKL